MELPHIGENCALKDCNRLDFLPVKCDACGDVFCLEHYQYEKHSCKKAQNRNVQVPVCPLCSEPVASRANQLPDLAVSQHIDQYCKRNELIKNRRKPKTNLQTCTFKSCKQKDLIYLECSDCRAKFCIKHRHPNDHQCPGPSATTNLVNNWQNFRGSCSSGASSSYELIKNKAQQLSKSGQAALSRIAQNKSSLNRDPRATANELQGGLSEQEALAIALDNSKQVSNQQESEDLALARALQESQVTSVTATRNRNAQKDTCVLS